MKPKNQSITEVQPLNSSSDTPDEYEERIRKSGCEKENEKVLDCFYDNGKDWRKCQKELLQFRKCFQPRAAEQIESTE